MKTPSPVPQARVVREGDYSTRAARFQSQRQPKALAARSAGARDQLRDLLATLVGMSPLLAVLGLALLMMWSAAMAASP